MKDSGVEWIGDIPKEWQVIKCKHLATVQSGFPFDSAKFSNSEGTPLIRIRDITSGYTQTFYTGEYDSEYIVSRGNLLIGMDGDFNIRMWQGTNALLNQRCCRVVSNSEIELSFLYYCLPFHLEITNNLAYATTVKHLSNSDILNAPVPYPQKCTRERIIFYLDSKCAEIDKVVEQTRATIEEYKKLKQAIITEAVTKGVRGPRPMKPSDVEWIGDIPEEWEVRKVSQFWKANKGPNAAQLTAEYCGNHPGAYPVYSGQTENNGVMGMIDTYSFDFGARGCLFSTTVGAKAMTVSCLYNKFSLSQNCMIMQPLSEKCDVRYYFYLFAFIFGYFRSLIPDYMQPSFRVKDFLSYCMLLPSVIEQQEIATYLDTKCAEIDRIIEKKEQLIEELGSYKKSLIYEYVTGKKEVTT